MISWARDPGIFESICRTSSIVGMSFPSISRAVGHELMIDEGIEGCRLIGGSLIPSNWARGRLYFISKYSSAQAGLLLSRSRLRM